MHYLNRKIFFKHTERRNHKNSIKVNCQKNQANEYTQLEICMTQKGISKGNKKM